MPQLLQPWSTKERGLRTSLDMRYLEFQAYSNYLKALLQARPSPGNNFLLLTTPRSGSVLLRALINCHPQIACDSEILLNFCRYLTLPRVLWLEAYIKGRRLDHRGKYYGCDLKLYHLEYCLTTIGTDSIQAFLNKLVEQGWKIIWLERKNSVRQALSMLRAETSEKWHLKAGVNDTLPPAEIVSDALKSKILWYEKMAVKGRHLLQSLPHLEVVYELDLLNADQHQATLDKIFDYLELPSVPVTASVLRTSSSDLSKDISNFEEVKSSLEGTKYEAFLDMP